MRYVKGSMTVEASLVVPMLIFILAGIIQSLFFLHDAVILQCYADKKTESILWQRESTEAIPVYMMAIQNGETSQSPLTKVSDWIGNQTSADSIFEGKIKIDLPGVRAWTGDLFEQTVTSHAIRVDYTKDRMAAVMKQQNKMRR